MLYPLAANTNFLTGDAVALNASGLAVVPTATTGLVAIGIAQSGALTADAAGNAPAFTSPGIEARPGAALFTNSGTHACSGGDVGNPAYFEGAGVVGNNATGKSAAGRILAIIGGQVLVFVGLT